MENGMKKAGSIMEWSVKSGTMSEGFFLLCILRISWV